MSDINVRKTNDWTELNVTLPDNNASETSKGLVRIATQDEVDQAVINDAVITPLTTAKGRAGGVALLDDEARIPFESMPIKVENRPPTAADTDDVLWVSTEGEFKGDVMPNSLSIVLYDASDTMAMYRGILSPDNVTNSLIQWSDGQISLSNGLITVDKKTTTFTLTAFAMADSTVRNSVTVAANPWLSASIDISVENETDSTITIVGTLNGGVTNVNIRWSNGSVTLSGESMQLSKQMYPYTLFAIAAADSSIMATYTIPANPWLSARIEVLIEEETVQTVTYRVFLYPETLTNKNLQWSNGATMVSGETITINKMSDVRIMTVTAVGNPVVTTNVNVPAIGMGTKMPPGSVVTFYNVSVSNRHPIFWGETAADEGWLVCDGGSDGEGGNVPNLLNRFIMGVTTVSAAKTTGGSASVSLTVANMPSHNHSISISGSASSAGAHTHQQRTNGGDNGDAWNDGPYMGGNNGNYGRVGYGSPFYTFSAGAHTHTVNVNGSSSNSGSGTSFSIQNPYYTLIYCVKRK